MVTRCCSTTRQLAGFSFWTLLPCLALLASVGNAQLYGAAYNEHSALDHLWYSNSLFEINGNGVMTTIASYTSGFSEASVNGLTVDPASLNSFALLTALQPALALANLEVGYVSTVSLNLSAAALVWEPTTLSVAILAFGKASPSAQPLDLYLFSQATHALSKVSTQILTTAKVPTVFDLSTDGRGNVSVALLTAEGVLALWTCAVKTGHSTAWSSSSALTAIPQWMVYVPDFNGYFSYVDKPNSSDSYFAWFSLASYSFDLLGPPVPFSFGDAVLAVGTDGTVIVVLGNMIFAICINSGDILYSMPLSIPQWTFTGIQAIGNGWGRPASSRVC